MNLQQASGKPLDDTIVCRLDQFPELAAALRSGDIVTARRICSQLFDLDSGATTPQRRLAITLSPTRTG
jgi:hypothetical protein